MGFPEYKVTVTNRNDYAKFYPTRPELARSLRHSDVQWKFDEMKDFVTDHLELRDQVYGPLPYNDTILHSYPAADPAGKYCEWEMQCSERLSRIKVAKRLRPENTKEFVDAQLDALTGWMDRAGADFQQLRLYECMAMMPAGPSLYKRVKKEHEELLKDGSTINVMNRLLDTMEYAIGISDKKPVPYHFDGEAVDPMRTIPDTVLAERETSHAMPDGFEVTMNLDRLVPTNNTALLSPRDPRELNLVIAPPDDLDPSKEEENRKLVAKYSGARINRLLDPLFNAAENATLDRKDSKIGLINRGDLIIINGKTVREIMAERFAESGGKKNDFQAFYEKNVRQAAGELVAGAILEGQRVEMFRPDKNGQIDISRPTILTHSGKDTQLAELKPVTFNAVHRFLNRHLGLFKERATKAEEYRAFQEARRRVELRNAVQRKETVRGSYQPLMDSFFGDWVAQNGPLPTSAPFSLSVDRTAFTSIAAYRVAMELGCSLEDIMDPTRFVEEKRRIGSEVVDKVMSGDGDWVSETFVRGAEIFNKQIAELRDPASSSYVDVSDPTQLDTRNGQILHFATTVSFDIFQEATRGKVGIRPMLASYAAKTPEYAQMVTQLGDADFVNAHIGKQRYLADYLSCVNFAQQRQLDLGSRGLRQLAINDGSESLEMKIAVIAQAKLASGLYKEAMQNTPTGTPPPDVNFTEYRGAVAVLPGRADVREMTRSLRNDPAYAEGFESSLASGAFEKALQVRGVKNTQGVTLDFDVKMPQIEPQESLQLEEKAPAQPMGMGRR